MNDRAELPTLVSNMDRVLTYRASPSRSPFTMAKQGYCTREKSAESAMTKPYSFPKWHDGKLDEKRERTKEGETLDANTLLNFPHAFATLHLLRGCGLYSFNLNVAAHLLMGTRACSRCSDEQEPT